MIGRLKKLLGGADTNMPSESDEDVIQLAVAALLGRGGLRTPGAVSGHEAPDPCDSAARDPSRVEISTSSWRSFHSIWAISLNDTVVRTSR